MSWLDFAKVMVYQASRIVSSCSQLVRITQTGRRVVRGSHTKAKHVQSLWFSLCVFTWQFLLHSLAITSELPCHHCLEYDVQFLRNQDS